MKIALGIILLASVLPIGSWSEQNRDFIDSRPSLHFPLGTDDLGRDRLARLAYATRTSLVLSGAAALVTTAVATIVAGAAVYLCDGLVTGWINLMLSLPWLFLLLAARALLPLNSAPSTSLWVTYALLALLGWAGPARVLRARIVALRDSGFVLHARAAGSSELRILARQIVPNLEPILLAQFWTSIPVFVLAEANLGFLGLSAGEPVPTWGNLLRELQNPIGLRPECFAALAVVIVSISCLKKVRHA